jgi:hypothetical protein
MFKNASSDKNPFLSSPVALVTTPRIKGQTNAGPLSVTRKSPNSLLSGIRSSCRGRESDNYKEHDAVNNNELFCGFKTNENVYGAKQVCDRLENDHLPCGPFQCIYTSTQ